VYDFLFVIIELFLASCYCWYVTGGNLSTWATVEGGSLRSTIKGGRGRRRPTTVGWQKTRRIALSCGIQNITGRFFGLVTKYACDRRTDGRTHGDGRTDGRTDRITTPKTALA